MFPYILRYLLRYPFYAAEFVNTRLANFFNGAKVLHESLLALRTYIWYKIQYRNGDSLLHQFMGIGYCETMSFIAYALDEVQHRITIAQNNRFRLTRRENMLEFLG